MLRAAVSEKRLARAVVGAHIATDVTGMAFRSGVGARDEVRRARSDRAGARCGTKVVPLFQGLFVARSVMQRTTLDADRAQIGERRKRRTRSFTFAKRLPAWHNLLARFRQPF